MLYNEVKAEQEFLTLINATVSHELRNPLNSLIGQITSMQLYFESFESLIESLEESKKVSKETIDHFKEIYKGLKKCGGKMTSAAKFIDFFVHDILDYTMLNKNAKNFIKDVAVFDIKKCINEIVEIQQDKIDLK